MTARRAFTVELTEDQIEQIEAHVTSGAHASAGEVVAAGVAELSEPDLVNDRSPEWLAFLDGVREASARLDRGEASTYTPEEFGLAGRSGGREGRHEASLPRPSRGGHRRA